MKLPFAASIGCLIGVLSASPISPARPAGRQNARVAKAPGYAITDLNITIRTMDHGPRGINAKGEIAGTVDKPDGTSVAFLYQKGVLTELPRSGGIESQAVSINDKGQIAGVIKRPNRRTSGEQIAVVWDKSGVREIGPLPGPFGETSTALPVTIGAINDFGEVVGYVSGWESTYTPFVWQNGVVLRPAQYEVGERGKLTVGPPPNTNRFPPATLRFLPKAINRRGQIVGTSTSGRAGGSFNHAMLWRNGTVYDLGVLTGGKNSRATAINEREQVAGTSSTEGTMAEHAFLWADGKMRDLGTLGGRSSEARAINNRGDVVGWADIEYKEVEGSSTTTWGGERAVLWRNGHGYNLNDLLPRNVGWVLERAVAINDKGQIIGIGYRSLDGGRSLSGGKRSFLLTPVSR